MNDLLLRGSFHPVFQPQASDLLEHAIPADQGEVQAHGMGGNHQRSSMATTMP